MMTATITFRLDDWEKLTEEFQAECVELDYTWAVLITPEARSEQSCNT
jgi:hypothetical protein